jgi:hypothetical protein
VLVDRFRFCVRTECCQGSLDLVHLVQACPIALGCWLLNLGWSTHAVLGHCQFPSVKYHVLSRADNRGCSVSSDACEGAGD